MVTFRLGTMEELARGSGVSLFEITYMNENITGSQETHLAALADKRKKRRTPCTCNSRRHDKPTEVFYVYSNSARPAPTQQRPLMNNEIRVLICASFDGEFLVAIAMSVRTSSDRN